MFFMLLAPWGIAAALFVLLLVVSSGYSAYRNLKRTHIAEHLRHYHLHALEESLQA